MEKIKLNEQNFELFIEKKSIKAKVKQLATEINLEFDGKPVTVIGILDGAFMFMADLMKRLNLNISLELIKLRSYSGMESTGAVTELIGLTSSLRGQRILIIEDIIDTGLTLEKVLRQIHALDPESVTIVSLLVKKAVFKEQFPIDYIGFSIPDRFVVGYGMDYEGQGRQLPEIYVQCE
jgi:hypoxanthine phosphoribosyltransferase